MSGYEPSLSETANDVFDGIEGLGRWLGRVATIALGTFHRPTGGRDDPRLRSG